VLASSLEEGVRRRSKKKADAEAKLYGRPLGEELATLLAVRQTHALEKEEWGELRPFAFIESFGLGGPDAAKKHLERRTQLGWPVYFDAHFWNAFPFGSTGGGDYWLAQAEGTSGGKSATYIYDHETGKLARKTGSIEELVRRSRKLPRIEASTSTPKPLFDPVALYKRTYWLTTLLGGTEPDDLDHELKKNAPPLSAFEKEKALLPTASHLALYWLFAHMILRNEDAFAEAYGLTKGSKHAFVASARVLCKKLFDDPKTSAGALTPKWRAHLDDTFTRLSSKQPEDVAGAIAALSPSKAKDLLVAFARKGGSPGSSKWPKDWRTLLAKRELAPLMILLFRRGQEAHWTQPLCSDWFIDPLAASGTPEAMEALIASAALPSHWGRKAGLARHLHASDDPRVEAFFERVSERLLDKKALEGAMDDEVLECARAVMKRWGRSPKAADVARLLGGPIPEEIQYELAELAVKHRLTAVVDALLARLQTWFKDEDPVHYACQDDFFHFGGALAALSPALAAKHFKPMWKAFLDYGPWEEAEKNPNLFGIGTAVLVPLLGSTAKAEFLPIAKTFASWKKSKGDYRRGAVHLERAFELSK
jgi:hypothetical protein